MKELKYPIACDKNENIIKASEAAKGTEYFCIYCGQEMILRKSEKQLKRTHFAHKALSPNCTPESALHLAFKIMLYEKIRDCLANGKPMPIKWQCGYCLDIHEGNLLKKISDARLEYNAGDCIPDIALLNHDGKLAKAIEIIVTHAPDQQAKAYYERNNIVLIEFHLKNENALELLAEPVLNPTKVSICLHDKCPKCDNRLSKKYLNIISAQCPQCQAPMKVAVLASYNNTYIGGPDKFTVNELEIASRKGVKLVTQHSKIIGAKYLANTCPSCDKYAGKYFLSKEYFFRATNKEYEREIIECGYFCNKCEMN